MYRFLLRPKWLFGHVLVAAVLVTFPYLGLWQLDRLDEVRADNERLTARLGAPPQPLDAVLAEHGDDVVYRRVEASGTWRAEQELLWTGRGYQGRPGHHVLTPLDLGEGRVVLVDRGWVPYRYDEPPVSDAAPPQGQVRLSGFLQATQPSASLGPRVPDTGEAEQVTAVDLERLDAQIDGELVPAYVQLQQQRPDGGELPVPPEVPEPDEGSHLPYAVQWFAFTAVAAIGYPLLVWRTARDPDPAAPTARPGPDAERPPQPPVIPEESR